MERSYHTGKLFTIILFIFSSCWWPLPGQSPSDALMMPGKQTCVLFDYSHQRFDQYWEGTKKRANQTIATVKRNVFMPMTALGITNRLNLFVGLPFIKTHSTEPNGGQLAGARGFQDLTLALKVQIWGGADQQSKLSVLGTLGFSTPVSKYNPDYQPYSLGLGAPELTYRGIVEYKLTGTWFFRFAGTFLWRGYARAEREYYYNHGSYYTSWMDVPHAYTFEPVVGKWLFNKSLQLELNYLHNRSLSGDDIRAYNAPQPTNKVNFDRLGIFAHFYFPSCRNLGLLAYYQRIIQGRNSPALLTSGVGVNYFFNYLKK